MLCSFHKSFQLTLIKNISPEFYEYQQHHETWCSFDFGISDPTSIIWYQILQVPKTVENTRGIIINIIDEYKTNNQPVSHYVDVINRVHRKR